ncbi:hypothetical protein PMI08_03144 [Brevibacillus sp. CF112]|uniref:hypothetical protein n=1 Tax=Brevibacillus sp. CF112 TaxID=1144311 RepID=UPI0002717F5E|nr:hypothetical protein [Brevibacillus sp. CF112]EJL42493.1 hypothetical protein PMI08_03144 [Brevibacillus sp. CF112]
MAVVGKRFFVGHPSTQGSTAIPAVVETKLASITAHNISNETVTIAVYVVPPNRSMVPEYRLLNRNLTPNETIIWENPVILNPNDRLIVTESKDNTIAVCVCGVEVTA